MALFRVVLRSGTSYLFVNNQLYSWHLKNVTSIVQEARKLESSTSEQNGLFVFVIPINVKKYHPQKDFLIVTSEPPSMFFIIMIRYKHIKMGKMYVTI